MDALDDMTLVARVVVMGDKRAFDLIVKRHQSQVRRFFLHQTLGDKALSDDLAQDTFVKAYQNIARFRAFSQFSTWLYRIACNVLYDHMRQNKQATNDLADVCASVASEDCGLRIDILQALAMLKPQERACIVLQLIEGQPINRIAEITALPEGTVKSHLARGKEKLTTYLRNNGYDRR